MEDTTLATIVRSYDYNSRRVDEILDKILSDAFAQRPALSKVSATIKRALRNIEIVYLPTYRRVELALRSGDPQIPSRRRKRPKFDFVAGGLFTGDIQFGLADISDRLAELNTRIVRESNNGYREISANIINELIDGSLEGEPDSGRRIPTSEELKLFFARLEGGRRLGPFYPVSIPNFDKLYKPLLKFEWVGKMATR